MAGAVGESERVSVVIPTYNRAALVGRAVRSALAETSPGDEVIVVDDGSTDDTEEALAPYRDRIRYFRARHGKAGAARNHGVREARNGLVAFLDSDDEWMPDKLVLQRAALAARPDAVFCFSDFATCIATLHAKSPCAATFGRSSVTTGRAVPSGADGH